MKDSFEREVGKLLNSVKGDIFKTGESKSWAGRLGSMY